MTDFRERYKRVGYGRENMDVNRAMRSQRRDEARREMRSEHFSLMRNVAGSQDDDQDDSLLEEEISKRKNEAKVGNIESLEREDEAKRKAAAELEEAIQKRWQRLEKWREERRRQKLKEKKKTKPVFKVGVVHHRVYSPPINKEPPPPVTLSRLCRLKEAHHQEEQQQQQTKRVTRATEKRLAMKAVTNQQKRENLRSKSKDSGQSSKKANSSRKELAKVPLAPSDHQFRAPAGVMAIPIFGRKALEASKENIQFDVSSHFMTTTTEFPQKIPSSLTESIFASKGSNDLFNESKSRRRSSLNKSNFQACDSTMEESVENISLKLSTDDADVLDDQENDDVNENAQRRSSKFFMPSTEAMDVESPPKEKRNERSMRSRRSLRMQSSTSVEETTSEVQNKSVSSIKSRRSLRMQSSTSVEDTPSELQNKSVSLGKSRRSLRMQSSTSVEDTPPEVQNKSVSSAKSRRSTRMLSSISVEVTPPEVQNESVSSVEDKKKPFGRRRVMAISSVGSESPKESEANTSYQTAHDRSNRSVSSSKSLRKSLNISKDTESPKESEVNSSYHTTQGRANDSVNSSASERKSVNISDRQDTESPNGSGNDSSMDSVSVKLNRMKSPANKRKSVNVSESPEVIESPKRLVKDSSYTVSKSDNSMMNSSKQNKIKTPTPKRKSASFVKPSVKEIESPRRTRLIRNNSSSIDESQKEDEVMTPEKLEKSTASKRRSTKSSDDFETPVFPGENDQLEDFVFSKPNDSPRRATSRFTINLMESTFSNLPESMQLSEDAPKTLLDDTIPNLSPRRSIRVKPLPSGPIKVSQSLVKLSPISKPINTSSSSEPPVQKDENEVMHNLSLNISLPSDSSDVDKPPAFFSPYIVQSRGKSSQRKEVQKRRFSQPAFEDIPTKENIMQKLNISVEEEEKTAQYFKLILGQEIDRLNELCDHWNVIKDAPETPEDIKYVIQAAVGQTQLLIRKKFERFRSLVSDCETGRGEMLVTCKDLQGFWEMMYMEITNCENRFNKLEEMKNNNWIDEEAEREKLELEKKKKVVKKPAAKKKPAVSKPSSLRAHIMAARKKKIESQGSEDGDVEMKEPVVVALKGTPTKAKPEDLEKTPVKNTRHISTPISANKWDSLLKKVQLSNTRKSTTSPLIVMKLGQMCKTPEVQLDDSIIYINSDRTPAKSILKSSKDETIGSIAKSTNKVFFNEQPPELREFELLSDADDSTKLENIKEDREPIERRLFKLYSSSSESEDEEKDEKEPEVFSHNPTVSLSPFNSSLKKTVTLPDIVIQPEETSPLISVSPLTLEEKKVTTSAMKSNNLKPKRQISFKDNLNESPARSFRSKKFSAPVTPIRKRNNSKDEDVDMEIDDQEVMDISSPAESGENVVKEMYMNSQGMICERVISTKKDTPRVSRLKRSNSEVSNRNKKNENVEDKTVNRTLSTPRLVRTKLPQVVIDTPNGSRQEKVLVSTPHVRKSELKQRSVKLDSTLTEDSANSNTEEAATPKSRRKTPKSAVKTKILADEKKEGEGSTTPRLKRTNSKTFRMNVESVDENISEIATPKSNRRSTKLLRNTNSAAQTTEESTPTSRRKSSKKLQENSDPNSQKNAEDINKSNKVTRTPSLKRSNSKKNVDFQSSDNFSETFKPISEEMTPNTRRKSLRISKKSTQEAV